MAFLFLKSLVSSFIIKVVSFYACKYSTVFNISMKWCGTGVKSMDFCKIEREYLIRCDKSKNVMKIQPIKVSAH